MNVRMFPVRRSREEKDAFVQAVTAFAEGLGNKTAVEEGGWLKSRNLVIGDPERAQMLFCAHYDTPARRLLPEISFPGRPVLSLVLEILKALFLMLPAFAVYLLFWSFLGSRAVPVFFLTYLALLALQVLGPAEKRNPGLDAAVQTLLEVMETLPDEARSRAAFVLFDHGELNRAGARQFAKNHSQAAWTRLMVQFERMEAGSQLVLLTGRPAQKAAGFHGLVSALNRIPGYKVSTFTTLPFSAPSDATGFACHVRLLLCDAAAFLGPMLRRHRKKEAQEAEGEAIAAAICACLDRSHDASPA